MIGEPAQPEPERYVSSDVDRTLIDAVGDQRRAWRVWAERYGLDSDEVYQVALRTQPMETFAQVIPDRDSRECLAVLHDPTVPPAGPALTAPGLSGHVARGRTWGAPA